MTNDIKHTIKKPTALYIILLTSILVLGFAFIAPVMWNGGADLDFAHTMSSGRVVIEEGFVRTEPLTCHDGWNYLCQCWLTGVLSYEAYSIAGAFGYMVLYYIVFSLTVLAIFVIVNRFGKNPLFAFITGLFAIGLLSFFIIPKARAFDYLISLCVFYCLYRFLEKPRDKMCLVPIPLLTVLLMNLHCTSYPLIFFFGGVAFIICCLKKDLKSVGYICLCGIICGAALFMTPYGIDGITYVWLAQSESISCNLFEWSNIAKYFTSLQPQSVTFIILSMSSIILLTLSFIKCSEKRHLIGYLLIIVAVFTYMGSKAYRNVPFAIIFDIIAISLCFYFLNISEKSIKNVCPPIVLSTVFATILCATGIYFGMNTTLAFPVDKVGMAIAQDIENKNLDVEYISIYSGEKGSYHEFFYRLRCYYDARAEVFTKPVNGKEDIFDEHLFVQANAGNEHPSEILQSWFDAWFERNDFDYLIVEKDMELLANTARAHGYILLESNLTSSITESIFVKSTL